MIKKEEVNFLSYLLLPGGKSDCKLWLSEKKHMVLCTLNVQL